MWRCKTIFQGGWGGEWTIVFVQENIIKSLCGPTYTLQVSVSNIKTLWTRLIVTYSCYCVHKNISLFSSLVAHSVRTISDGIIGQWSSWIIVRWNHFSAVLWTKALHVFRKCKRTRLFFSFRKHRSLPDSDNTGEL